jgi:hypothetical protein
MSGEEIRRQISVCDSAKGTKEFTPAVEELLAMLPSEMRSQVEGVEGVYTETEQYTNRFVNMVLISVEFSSVRTLNHEAALDAIKTRLGKP